MSTIRRTMRLTLEMWSEIQTYLFIDLKLNDSPNNVSGQKSRYKVLSEYFYENDFTRQNFNLFMVLLKAKGYSASYLNNIIKLAKHIDRYYNIGELLDYTYFDTPTYHFVDTFSPEEIKAIANFKFPYKHRWGKTSMEINLKYKTIYLFLGLTGCRIGELINLKWVDYFGDYVIFRTTKNGDERPVVIPDFITVLLDQLPRESEYVFDARNPSTINDDLKKRCARLGIVKKQIHVHVFRHSLITQLIKSNASLVSIAKLVGHRSLDSTQIYSHMVLDDMRLCQSFHPLCREEADIESLSRKIRDFTESIVDKNKYNLQFNEGVDFFLRVAHK